MRSRVEREKLGVDGVVVVLFVFVFLISLVRLLLNDSLVEQLTLILSTSTLNADCFFVHRQSLTPPPLHKCRRCLPLPTH